MREMCPPLSRYARNLTRNVPCSGEEGDDCGGGGMGYDPESSFLPLPGRETEEMMDECWKSETTSFWNCVMAFVLSERLRKLFLCGRGVSCSGRESGSFIAE